VFESGTFSVTRTVWDCRPHHVLDELSVGRPATGRTELLDLVGTLGPPPSPRRARRERTEALQLALERQPSSVLLLGYLNGARLDMTLSSVFLLFGREAWHTANALQEPVYFLSGLYFPIRSLGALGMAAAGVLPLTLGTDALRQVLMGPAAQGLLPLPVEAAALAGFGVLFLWLAGRALEYLEALSKREGRLTQRWQ